VAQADQEKFERIVVPELIGANGTVRLTLFGAPALRSKRTGAIKAIEDIETDDGEGGVDVIDPVLFLSVRTMFACGSYVMKLKEYLPRLIFQCTGCQGRLSEGPGEPHHFEFEVQALNLPTFRVRLDAPAVACPACGRHVVLWSDEMMAQVESAAREAWYSLPGGGNAFR
jgi:hypothetical protein